MTKAIKTFDGEYRFLSNFYPCKITVKSVTYPSVEHAYQAAKTKDIYKKKVLASKDVPPGRAKKIGKTLEIGKSWNKNRVKVMYVLVRKKFFDNPHLAKKLIETGSAMLIEGNYWHDDFWGVCDKNKGQNILGKILMLVRSELIASRGEEYE